MGPWPGRRSSRDSWSDSRTTIIFGYSHLGKDVIEKLEELGFEYVVITVDAQLYSWLLKNNTLAVLQHESRPIEALKQAGIDRAGMLIVSHQDDPQNMMITLSARRLRPHMRIVASCTIRTSSTR